MKQKHYNLEEGIAIYKRLLGYVFPYKKVFFVAILGMILYAATDTGFAALMKPLIDGSFIEKDQDLITWVPILIIIIFIIRGVSGFLTSYFMSWIGRAVIKELRKQMFSHLLVCPNSFYDHTPAGKLVAKFLYDVEQVARAATQAITVAIRDSLTIIILLGYMLYLNWKLAIYIFILAPIVTLLIQYINKRFRKISKNIQDSMGSVASRSEEAIKGHQVIKIFGGQRSEEQRFEKVNDQNQRQNMKLVVTSAASIPIIQLIAACTLSGIIFFATRPEMLEAMTPGIFMSFIVAMMMTMAPLKRLTTVNVTIQRGIAAAHSIFSLLDSDPEKDQGNISLESVRGEIEFRNVHFSYSEEKGLALHDINVLIEPGQTVAIVGRSGSGKTSMANLIPRFYTVDSGNIFIDGINIEDIKLDSLRHQVSFVGQQVMLFNDTIFNNIAYGSDVGPRDVEMAAEAAHAMEYIVKLPNGLQTQVGENGVLLSGGQRQRLAIARALLKNAPILILDEATAALDTESERHIQLAVETLIKDRTTLVIAHRLSTIENADKIIVLDKGKIIESGSHHELLAQNQSYANLHRLQFDRELKNS